MDKFQIIITSEGDDYSVELIDYKNQSKTNINKNEIPDFKAGSTAWFIEKIIEHLKPNYRKIINEN